MKFTPNEINLLADTLNGCGTSIAVMEHYIPMMCNSRADAGQADRGPETRSAYCSGLELEVYDSIRLNQADKHWQVDGALLLAKLRQITPAGRELIVRAMGRAWDDCNGPAWELELSALVAHDFETLAPAAQ